MRLVLCLDNNNGLRFNGRRQSRDIEVSKKILNILGEGTLRIAPESAVLFLSLTEKIVAECDYLQNAADEDTCFCENIDFIPYTDKVGQIVVFRWNRTYPADVFLPAQVYKDGFLLASVCEFPGKSHALINMEVYEREN